MFCLPQVADLDRCRLCLRAFAELTRLHADGAWGCGAGLWRVLRSLRNASIRHLQDVDGGQVTLWPRPGHAGRGLLRVLPTLASCLQVAGSVHTQS